MILEYTCTQRELVTILAHWDWFNEKGAHCKRTRNTMIPMHTDRPNLDESCHCPQSRPAALIRVLDIEPALAPRMACPGRHSSATSRRALFQTKLKLARQLHHGTDCGWTSKSPVADLLSLPRLACSVLPIMISV